MGLPVRQLVDLDHEPVRHQGHPTFQFYSQVDAARVHGLANVISFDFNGRTKLPLRVIVSLARG